MEKKSKDPAFLFYSNDFFQECLFLSNEEVGILIRLMCIQHQHGNIPKKRLGFLLGFEWVSFSDELKKKFVEAKNEDGEEVIYSPMLAAAIEKRSQFIDKQKSNGQKGGRPKTQIKPKQNPDHNPNKTQSITQTITQTKPYIENENENINDIKNRDKEKGGTGGKTTRGKKSETKPPKIQFAEFVSMTSGEYEALVTKFGVEDTARMIEILDNYKGSSGKVYASDYRAILTWVVARLKEEKEKQGNNQHNGTAANKNGLEGTNRTDKSNPRRNYAEQCRTEQEVLKQVSLAVLQQS